MASPVGAISSFAYLEPSTTEDNPRAAAKERRQKLSNDQLIQGTSISLEGAGKTEHLDLTFFLMNFRNHLENGTDGPAKIEAAIKAFKSTKGYQEHQAEYDQVLGNIRNQLNSFTTEQNQSLAKPVLELGSDILPSVPAPDPTPEPADAAEAEGEEEEKKEEREPKVKDPNFSFGAYLGSNRAFAALSKAVAFNADTFMPQQDTRAGASFTFSAGKQTMEVGAYGGGGALHSVPGSGLGKLGKMAFGGVEAGFVNPVPPRGKFEASTMGFEVIGVTDHSGKGEGVPTPKPVFRFQASTRNPWAFALGEERNFQISLVTFLNKQSVSFNINNPPLEAADSEGNPVNSPWATAGRLFPSSVTNVLEVGLRWWPSGAPQPRTQEDYQRHKLEPGESLPTVIAVATGDLINFSRRVNSMAPFALNRVGIPTGYWFGADTEKQYNRIGLGFGAYSAFDSYQTAQNAANRADVMRRGDWPAKIAMLSLDGVHFVTDIFSVARAEGDPPVAPSAEAGQDITPFAENPGMVTDFWGRGSTVDLGLFTWEWGLTGLDWSGAFGRLGKSKVVTNKKGKEVDRAKQHYIGAHVAATVVGFVTYMFSAPLSGVKCGTKGTQFFACSFGTNAYTDGFYFNDDHPATDQGHNEDTGPETGPKDIRQVQRQYGISVVGGSLITKGLKGLAELLFLPKQPSSGHQVHPGDVARKKKVQVTAGVGIQPNGASVNAGIRF